VDLIAEQLLVASGAPLSIPASGPQPRGHAIECRINAEDTANGRFIPTAGRIEVLTVPTRTGVRFDQGYEAGDRVEPYYDSMIGKLVVWAPTREMAIRRSLAAISDMKITGLPTTIPALVAVLNHPDFQRAAATTTWLESSVSLSEETDVNPAENSDVGSRREEVTVNGQRYVIPRFDATGKATSTESASLAGIERGTGARQLLRGEPGLVTSPMQGVLASVSVAKGDLVTADQVLFVLEAMKMQNQIQAGIDGTVTELNVSIGDAVSTGSLLARVEPVA
jgi:acetyl-CoA/propionyl-CoA carboxylase biotin carboxyl carrier protein